MLLNTVHIFATELYFLFQQFLFSIGDYSIEPVPIVRDLGAWLDSRLSMATHVTKTCSSAFYQLYNIRRIRKYLSRESAETLIHAFITSRADYCNSLLYGLPKCQLNELQRVQNAAARLIFNASQFCHITPLLVQLHWLPVIHRITDFKILLITRPRPKAGGRVLKWAPFVFRIFIFIIFLFLGVDFRSYAD